MIWTWIDVPLSGAVPVESGKFFWTARGATQDWRRYRDRRGLSRQVGTFAVLRRREVEPWLDGWQVADAGRQMSGFSRAPLRLDQFPGDAA